MRHSKQSIIDQITLSHEKHERALAWFYQEFERHKQRLDVTIAERREAIHDHYPNLSIMTGNLKVLKDADKQITVYREKVRELIDLMIERKKMDIANEIEIHVKASRKAGAEDDCPGRREAVAGLAYSDTKRLLAILRDSPDEYVSTRDLERIGALPYVIEKKDN